MIHSTYLGLSEEGFHQIAYTEWGTKSSTRPLICVHGLTRNRLDFIDLAEYLSSHGKHVFCPDIVGRGDSDWLKNPLHYTYEQYLADMTTMIARTDAREIDWLGTSMGGLIGMLLAAQNNTPIRRLILNDVGAQIPVKAITRLSKYAEKDPAFTSIEEAKNHFKNIYADFGPLTEEQWQRLTTHSVKEVAPGKFITKLDHGVKSNPAKSKLAWQILLHPHKALEGTLFDIDLWHVWRNVTCPVLIIRGKRSDMLLPSIVNKMQEIHPQTDLIEVDDAGHAPALLDREIHEKIFQWLER